MATPLEIRFMCLGYKQIYCIITSCCIISVLFWELHCYRNFLLTFWDRLNAPASKIKNLYSFDFWPLKMGPLGCFKMSVRNCNYSLRNNSEEPSFYLLCSGNLKSVLCFTKFHLFYDFVLFCSNTFFINCVLCKCFWIMWCTGACSMWRIKYL
jgi:hypothetical protein